MGEKFDFDGLFKSYEEGKLQLEKEKQEMLAKSNKEMNGRSVSLYHFESKLKNLQQNIRAPLNRLRVKRHKLNDVLTGKVRLTKVFKTIKGIDPELYGKVSYYQKIINELYSIN